MLILNIYVKPEFVERNGIVSELVSVYKINKVFVD